MTKSGGEQSPKHNVSRRRLIVAGVAVAAVGAGVFTVERNWRSISRWVAGRTGPQNRDLQWFYPGAVSIPEEGWVEYDKDPDAVADIHRLWKSVGGLAVDKEAYSDLVGQQEDGGRVLRQAYAFKNGNLARVGVAYPGDDPSFFGETNDNQSYLVGAKIGHGLQAMLGGYDDKTNAFYGIETERQDPMQLEDFLAENPKATWV